MEMEISTAAKATARCWPSMVPIREARTRFSGQTDAAADANQDLGFSAGALFNSVTFQTLGSSAIAGGFPGGGMRFGHPNLGGPGGQGPSSFGSGAHMGAEHFGPHGRFGAGDSDFTATLRVNLGDLGGGFSEKPTITATAVDPATQELWAAVGDALVHFSKGGDPVEVYYLTLKGGAPVKPSAILVEPVDSSLRQIPGESSSIPGTVARGILIYL